jgi:hypothetical protein
VRVRSYDEILATLDTRLSNRGLWFDAELVPFCGKTVRVGTSVERFVDEKTGHLRTMKTPAVVLEGVTCKSALQRPADVPPAHDQSLVARNLAGTRVSI